jgi:mycothiol synthase
MVDVRRVPPEEYAGAPAAALELIVSACAAGDGRDPLDESAHLRLRHHGLEGSALWLADGGFALVRGLADASDGSGGAGSGGAGPVGRAIELDLAVAPELRRRGVGRSLLSAALAGLDERDVVRAWSHGDHPAAAVLARGFDFAKVRELLVLRRPLSADGAALEGDPRIRGYRPGDAAELLRVNAAAFVDHPEQGALDEAGLAERMAEPWFDPAGLLVAVDGDRMLGFHWTKLHGNGHGEVYVLAVDPAAQGLGVGRSLTATGLGHLAAVGAHSVHLYVEATNTAALALYRGQGFMPDHTHVQYQRG